MLIVLWSQRLGERGEVGKVMCANQRVPVKERNVLPTSAGLGFLSMGLFLSMVPICGTFQKTNRRTRKDARKVCEVHILKKEEYLGIWVVLQHSFLVQFGLHPTPNPAGCLPLVLLCSGIKIVGVQC